MAKEEKMKKIKLLMCLLVTACVNSNDEYITQKTNESAKIESELAQEKDVVKTLKYFREYYHEKCLSNRACYTNSDVNLPGIPYSYDMVEPYVMTTVDFNADKKCFVVYQYKEDNSISYKDNSDECILARRQAPKTEIGYFNFKKYLPTNTVIKTEQQFQNLYALYIAIRKNRNDCKSLFGVSQVTQTEKEMCHKYQEKFLQDFAMGRAEKCSKKYGKQYKQYVKEHTDAFLSQFKDNAHVLFASEYLCVPDEIGIVYNRW